MPSTVIAHIDYDKETAVLRIRFLSGMIYEYKKVPERIFNAMKNATSKGSFLNKIIKGKYDYEKIDG